MLLFSNFWLFGQNCVFVRQIWTNVRILSWKPFFFKKKWICVEQNIRNLWKKSKLIKSPNFVKTMKPKANKLKL